MSKIENPCEFKSGTVADVEFTPSLFSTIGELVGTLHSCFFPSNLHQNFLEKMSHDDEEFLPSIMIAAKHQLEKEISTAKR